MSGINHLESLKVFRAVVECNSYSKAAVKLNVSPSWVSKTIDRLETALKTKLFVRNTRHLHLTVNGTRVYSQSLDIIDLWDCMARDVRASDSSLEGSLRVGAPMSWGLVMLCPIVNQFAREYPEVRFDIELSDQQVNVVGEKFDLVLRITSQLLNSSLLSRKICSYRRIACMSSSLRDQIGEPSRPGDVQNFNPLFFSSSGSPAKWTFSKNEKSFDVYFEPYVSSNNSLVLKSYLVAGMGMALIPEFLIREEVERGEVVEVLRDYSTQGLDLFYLRPGGGNCSSRLAVFQDYLTKMIRGGE